MFVLPSETTGPHLHYHSGDEILGPIRGLYGNKLLVKTVHEHKIFYKYKLLRFKKFMNEASTEE